MIFANSAGEIYSYFIQIKFLYYILRLVLYLLRTLAVERCVHGRQWGLIHTWLDFFFIAVDGLVVFLRWKNSKYSSTLIFVDSSQFECWSTCCIYTSSFPLCGYHLPPTLLFCGSYSALHVLPIDTGDRKLSNYWDMGRLVFLAAVGGKLFYWELSIWRQMLNTQ